MNISGGAIEFEVLFNNGKIQSTLQATKQQIQDFSNVAKAGGQGIESAYQSAVAQIDKGFTAVGTAIKMNNDAVAALEKRYTELGEAAAAAFNKGNNKQYAELTKQQSAIRSQIGEHKKVAAELASADEALLKYNKDLETQKQQVDKASNANVRFRTQLMNVKNEMMKLEQAGKQNTAEYAKLTAEAKRLANAMYAANQQVKVLTTTKGVVLSGILSGVTGLSGAFTAAQGAMGLFADKNEDLQRIMLKVQSLMSITIGLQQISQALHTSSALRIGVINKLQAWWNTAKAKAIALQVAETSATAANTAVKSANTAATAGNTVSMVGNTAAAAGQAVAANAGTIANLGLAGSFRAVGIAIKSIPVFGWIIAGVAALVAIVSKLVSTTSAAAKEQKELNKKFVELAYKPLATINQLSLAWSKLGNNIKEKNKFIDDNKEKFDSLGVSVKNIRDAENLLIANKDKFIEAQILKAKALAATELGVEKYKKIMEEYSDLSDKEFMRTFKYTPTTPGAFLGGSSMSSVIARELNNAGDSSDLIQELLKNGSIKLNESWVEWNKKYQEYQSELADAASHFFGMAAQFTAEEQKILAELGQSANNITEGSIKALEDSISKLRVKYKEATSDSERNKLLKEIKAQEALLAKTDYSSSSGKDPFATKLEEQKKQYKEYFNWINAGREKEAQTEFASLLKNGKTYKDYLQGLLDSGKLTKEQIHQVTSEMVGEATETELGRFEKEIKKQIDEVNSLAQKLEILEQRKNAISEDDPLKQQKDEIITKQTEDTQKQIYNETAKMLQSYSAYLEKKIDFDLQYGKRRKELELQLEKETDEEKRRIILAQLEGLEKDKKKYDKQTGDEDYDKMVEEYRTFEQRKEDISKEFDAKIQKAAKHNNSELVAALEEAKAKALSKLSLEELQASDTWQQLFGNLDKLSVKKMIELRDKLEAEWEKLDLNPEELDAIRDKLDEITDKIKEKNPFQALSDAIRKYKKDKKDGKETDMTEIFHGIAGVAQFTGAVFDSVIDGIEKMGIKMDEEGQAIVADIAGIIQGAGQLAEGLATGNPLSIIQGSISIISNGIDLIFGAHDRKAEKSIKRHAEAIAALERAYNQLSWTIDKALGVEVYKNQQAAIRNMRQQQIHLKEMWEAEQSKKDSDANRINDFKEQYAQLGRDIEDMIDEITKDLLQTDAKSFADELGDSLAEAFAKGENAANAFNDTVNNVIKNIVLNQLKKNFLEKQLEPVLKNLEDSMGYYTYSSEALLEMYKLKKQIADLKAWNVFGVNNSKIKELEDLLETYKAQGDQFIFDGLTDAEIAAFRSQVEQITGNFNLALENYAGIFEDLAEQDTSLTGAVKGVTEETASIVAGQLNAMRINQSEGVEIMRQQLIQIAAIAQNTTYNRYLESIDARLGRIENSDALRAYGIGG
jgi:hypothetical protein